MAIQEQQLAQHRENSTSAVSIYSPGSGETAIIKTITLCNTTTSPALYSLYTDNDGTTYDESTARYFDISLAGKSTTQINTFWAMNNSSGNIAFKNSVANAITVTIDGAVIT